MAKANRAASRSHIRVVFLIPWLGRSLPLRLIIGSCSWDILLSALQCAGAITMQAKTADVQVSMTAARPVKEALALCRFGIVGAILISMVMNVLVLTGPFYMLQIYDRVLPAHSISTLVAFSILALILFVTYGSLDLIRTRLMAHLGAVLDLKLADVAFNQHTQVFGQIAGGSESLRDLGIVRQFLAGPAAVGLLDVPWLPFYMGIIFLLHPVVGWVAIGSAVVLLIIAGCNEWSS